MAGDPNDAMWLRKQLERFVEDYTPIAQIDIMTKDEHSRGRGFGYEQALGVVRAILAGTPYANFVWKDNYNVVPRPIPYKEE